LAGGLARRLAKCEKPALEVGSAAPHGSHTRHHGRADLSLTREMQIARATRDFSRMVVGTTLYPSFWFSLSIPSGGTML
jgi:hypothetical protein